MNYKDNLQKFLFENIHVRGEIVHIDQSYQTIIEQHDYPTVIKHLLGQALVIVNLLSSILKYKGRITVQFQAKGPLKLLLAQCNHLQQMRGLAQWEGEVTDDNALESLRSGMIMISIQPDGDGKRYQGIVQWEGDSLAQSIEAYFRNSEQLLTKIWVAVSPTQAAGLLLQMMPKNRLETSNVARENEAGWEELVCLTNTMKDEELFGLDNETLLRRLYHENDLRLFDAENVSFLCTCNVQKGEQALLLLGKAEVDEELKSKQVMEVCCDFCNKKFIYDKVDIERIFYANGNPPPDLQIH